MRSYIIYILSVQIINIYTLNLFVQKYQGSLKWFQSRDVKWGEWNGETINSKAICDFQTFSFLLWNGLTFCRCCAENSCVSPNDLKIVMTMIMRTADNYDYFIWFFLLFINHRRLRISNSLCLIVWRNLNSVNATILRIWSSRHSAILRILNTLYSIVSRNLNREYATILRLWNSLYSTVLRISSSLSWVVWRISIIFYMIVSTITKT